MSTQLAVLNPAANEVLPSPQQWQTMLSMADILVKSGLLPEAIKTPAQAVAVILKGRELCIPAMQSMAHIHIIEGKPSCSAELQLALLARGGVTWKWLDDGTTCQKAVIEFYRAGFEPQRGSFSKEDAMKALKKGKDGWKPLWESFTWKQYPANMLRARAISNGARMIGPDLLAGMSYTPEELGAEVDEEGRIIEGRQPVEPAKASEPAPKAHKRPTTVKTPAGDTVDTTTGEIVDPGAPPAVEEAAPGQPVDPEEAEKQERAALIVEIERLEKVFNLTDEQKTTKRVKYWGNSDFDMATLDGLAEYERRLSAAAGTGATGATAKDHEREDGEIRPR